MRGAAFVLVVVTWFYFGPSTSPYGNGHTLAQETNRAHRSAQTKLTSAIPRRLMFVAVNGFLTKGDLDAASASGKHSAAAFNVQRTVRMHRNVSHTMYTDDDCLEVLLEQKRHALVHAFRHEKYAPFKSDICRAAALFKEGGFYLDNDIATEVDVVEVALRTGADVVSMAELSDGGVCNAFVGATAGHKVLAGQLDRMTAYYQGVYKLSSPGRAHSERQLGAPDADPPLSLTPDADAEPGAEPPLTQAEAGRQRRRMTSLPPTTTAPPGYVLVHKNKLVGPATLRDAIAASGAEDGVYLFTESRLPFYKHSSWQRRLAAFLCGDCGVMALDPGTSDVEFSRALDVAQPLFYARNLGSRGCPPLYRIVLEHCLGWAVFAAALVAVSSYGHLWRERLDVLRARARGLTLVGSAAAADE